MTGNGNGALPDQLHETAARGVEAINMLVVHRDQLQIDNDRLQTENMLLRERNTQQGGQLAERTIERDHYMRYCTELTTKLNDIQMLILNCVEAAKHAAYRPTNTVPKQTLADIDTAGIERLIKRLPQNGGEE